MLFQPDLFSVSQPSFGTPSEAHRRDGERVLEQYYQAAIGPLQGMWQLGGSEVNSRNLKVETQRGIFLLKWVSPAAASDHHQACLIAQHLAAQGCPVTPPIENNEGALISRDAQGGWTLWPFVEGAYFTGAAQEMAGIAHAVDDLQGHLAHLPTALWPSQKVDLDVKAILQAFSQTDLLRDTWDSMFDAKALPLVQQHWPAVLQAAVSIEENASALSLKALQPAHIDLHPHNILMRGDQVAAILDVDAIVQYAPLAACGFAAFKLFRQHAVCVGGGAQSTALHAAFDTFSKALAPQYSVRLVLEGGRLEVSRRLAYILNAILSEGRSDWGHVLGVQLAALTEISWLLEEV